jgi:hypothetical protein
VDDTTRASKATGGEPPGIAPGAEADRAPYPEPAVGTAAARRVVEVLRAAFATSDEQALAAVLHPEARWGDSCGSRSQVLDWYRALHRQGVRVAVRSATVSGDAIVLGLAVTQSGASERLAALPLVYQAFTVTDGLITEIREAEPTEP